ncbi:hypothetical protein L3X38_036537 [Prunus dulcis]|uniref:Aminotransferase-like plant mobile domain-containing protein n=1 Tax=Prunus dulcis TaxID=3755 RepID=A0AAD4V1E9_PRUDU|nr:hypothetical protein L3X38_036537 [Prunus dulcis]
MGISLYDLKVIGGLPILGLPYDEFIPLNRELCREDLYPSTTGELLKIHAQLCVFHKKGQVFHDQWIEHFFRGEAIYGAAGNKNNIVPKHKAKDLKFPLNISREGQLAAFLAFWLSRFVLLLDNAIRPECFYMASLMARGFRVSLAPAVLGLIYHALGTVATHRRGPGLANAYLPIHYVIGWLGEHFPDLIDRRSDNDFPAHYPLLARYSQIEAKYVSSNQARIIFRSEFMVYRPSVFLAQEDCILLDTESLADDAFEFLVCMRSALLPVRLGGDLWLEPYYPNRFGRQFGFDQGVPENKLLFSNSLADDQFPESVGPIAVVRPLQNLVSVANFVHQIFGNGVNQNRREFISREIEGIFSRLYSSETPAQLHMHHSEITKALRLLGSTVDILGCGETAFKQFAQLVDWIFELARRHSKSSAYIEALGDVNIDVIHDLIRQHEECLNTKLALEAELTEVAKEIEDLDVKEVTIREAEERVRQMREEHEAKKTSLNMQKMNFEISLEHQNEQAIQLQQSRIDAKEDLLPHIGSTRLSMKAQEREIHRLINALFSSCSKL